MRYRVVNGVVLKEIYTDEFLQQYSDFTINGQLVSEWELTDILPTEAEKQYVKLMFADGVYFEGATDEEIEAIENAKINQYRAKIFDKFEYLLRSAKERALDKVGHGLTQRQLDDLELSYIKKNSDALKILENEQIDQVALDTLNFEIEFDLNNQVTLIQYAGIIAQKFAEGNALFNHLKSMAENFRSRLLTDLRNKDFERIDNRFLVIEQITPEMNLTQLQDLNNIFNEAT